MKKMFCKKAFVVIFPIVVVVSIVNYCVDPAGIYHGEEYADKIIFGLQKMKNVTNVDCCCNQRIFKKKYAELCKNKHYNYLILGSSRVLEISENIIPAMLLNLGMFSSGIQDIIAMHEICAENKISYDTIIIGMDFYTLSYRNDASWKEIDEYFYRFIKKNKLFHCNIEKIRNIFSVSYFQQAINKKRGNVEYVDFWCSQNEGLTFHTDGSACFPVSMRTRSEREVNHLARNNKLEIQNISSDNIEYMELLIKDLISRNIKIYFFFAPYHPIYYYRLKKDKNAAENERLLHTIAERFGIDTIGSFDPEAGGFVCSDFYDATHPKTETIDRILKEYFADKEKESN